MGLFGNLKLALALSRAWSRIKEEASMGHGKAAIFGVASAVLSGVAMRLWDLCPDLATQWPAMLTAGAMAGIGVYLQSPIGQDAKQ